MQSARRGEASTQVYDDKRVETEIPPIASAVMLPCWLWMPNEIKKNLTKLRHSYLGSGLSTKSKRRTKHEHPPE